MRTARAVPAGGVVLSEPAADALVARRSASGALQWTLPKGAQEPGASMEEAPQAMAFANERRLPELIPAVLDHRGTSP